MTDVHAHIHSPQAQAQAGPSTGSALQGDTGTEAALNSLDMTTFDINAYEATYKGRALLTRYQHILTLSQSQTPSSISLALARTACLHMYPIIKAHTWDHGLYLSVMSRLEHLRQLEWAEQRRSGGSGGMEVEGGNVAGMGMAGGGRGAGLEGEDNGVPDMEWVEETIEKERKETARLDVELRGYMSNLIKESIRLTYLASAELAYKCGNPQNAIKNYLASREYSTSAQHHIDLGLGILNTALAYNQPTTLPGQIQRLESYLDRVHPPPQSSSTAQGGASRSAPDPATLTTTAGDIRESRERDARGAAARRKINVRLRVARAWVAMTNKEYERAGREFGEISEEGGLGDWEGEVISTSDLCLMTALCVLATGSREKIRNVLLDRPSFRIGLDDSQSWVIDLVRGFMDAKYGLVSSIMAKAEPLILLNPLLSSHTATLIHLIRTRAIVQYIEPFSSIRIDAMASAFGTPTEQTLQTIEGLIVDGKVKGRIDLIDMVLVVETADLREQVYKRALRVGQETLPRTHAALIRMKLHEAGITVDPRVNLEKKDSAASPPLGAGTAAAAAGGGGGSGAGGWQMGPTDSNELINGVGSLGGHVGDLVDVSSSSDGEGDYAIED